MKKAMIGFVAMVCVISVVCFGAIMTIKESYEVKFAEATSKYEARIQDLKNENNESELRISELENAIYSIMMDEDYSVQIHYNGDIHTFAREYDATGIFSSVNHRITR